MKFRVQRFVILGTLGHQQASLPQQTIPDGSVNRSTYYLNFRYCIVFIY
jgi:hypothetical protein